MKHIRNEAINAGIPATKIHYEVFGPDIWLAIRRKRERTVEPPG